MLQFICCWVTTKKYERVFLKSNQHLQYSKLIVSLKFTPILHFSPSKSTIEFEFLLLTSEIAEVNRGHKKQKCTNFKTNVTFNKESIEQQLRARINTYGHPYYTHYIHGISSWLVYKVHYLFATSFLHLYRSKLNATRNLKKK